MKNRIKKALALVISSRTEAAERVTELAELANERRWLATQLDEELIGIKAEYGVDIAKLDAQIEQARQDLEAWAIAHPDEFGKKKSIEFGNGTIGFRTGTPKLELLNRKWTWKTVTTAVEQLLPNFIRYKPEVDKDAIIGQREELAEFLPSVGLKVTQGESFFVEPKLTDEVAA
jgi:phage host-nuclease inhibitor protein Gam